MRDREHGHGGLLPLLEHQLHPPGIDRHPRNPAVPKRAAHGHIRDPGTGKIVDTTHWNLSYAWTAGGAWSTLRDVRIWSRALATGHGVLGRRLQRERLEAVPIPGTNGVNAYGLGIFEIKTGGELRRFSPLLGHDGKTFGYDSFVLYSPREKLAIAALGNTSTSQDPVRRSPEDSEAMPLVSGKLLEAIAS